MFEEEKYYLLTDAEKEKFAKVGSYLLAHTFLTREVYEYKDKLGKINPDYRFVEKYFDLFSQYLDMFGYTLDKDDAARIYGNLVKLD